MGFLMKEFHDRSDDSFRLAIGSGSLDLRESLFDSMLPAKGHECMMLRISPILLSVVAVKMLYRIETFLHDLFQKCLGGILGLVRQDCRIQLTGEVIDGNKHVFSFPQKSILP